MSRRGRSGPVISLFAFQDIITSVTAIVIVVTLFLSLDLTQRNQGQAAATPVELVDEIEERISAIETELSTLRRELQSTDELIKQVASTSPTELKAEINRRERVLDALQREFKRQEDRRKQLIQASEAVAAERFDLAPLQQKIEQTVRETRNLQGQVDQETQENRILFTLPRGFNKEGWIAVVEFGQITVAPMERNAKPMVFVSTGAVFKSTAAEEMMTWIDRSKLRSAYFLILVRPTGARMFSDLEECLHKKSISFGFDLIDAHRTVLHPERGAAP